jgi:hypothetical protein
VERLCASTPGHASRLAVSFQTSAFSWLMADR